MKMGLVISKGRMFWAFPGWFGWLPEPLLAVVCSGWNRAACQVLGHYIMDDPHEGPVCVHCLKGCPILGRR